jgi:parvulin-like peptidyl-prolyl isomerase
MRFKFTFIILIAWFFLIPVNFGASAEKKFLLNGKAIPQIIAVVNGEGIDSNFLVNQIKIWKITRSRQGLSVSDKEEKEYALNTLNKAIDQELLFQKGKEKNIKIKEETIQKEIENMQSKFPDVKTFLAALAFQDLTIDRLSRKIEKQLTEESFIRMEMAPKVDVSAKQVEDVYEKNKAKYVTAKKYRVSHIFVNSVEAPLGRIENENDRKKAERFSKILDIQAKELMYGILEKLKQGANFAELAKKNSEDDTSREKGGDLGEVNLNQTMPALASEIAKLTPGNTSKVVKTSFGYHILKLNQIIPSRKVSLKEVKTDILNALLKIEVEKKKKEYISDLRKSAKIKTFL